MRREFYIASTILIATTFLLGFLWSGIWVICVLFVALFFLGVYDLSQNKHSVTKNFPVVGHFRFLFEMVRPELQQYFVENNTDGRPVSREIRSVVYQRSKGDLQTIPFGTQRDLYTEKQDWVYHSLAPKSIDPRTLRVHIGGRDCQQGYSSSLFNISAMSYGSLSKNAIQALNLGAKEGGFFHNTGEGGISPHHLKGGDLVWQLGTGYFGCRTEEGHFDPIQFQEKANQKSVKMIEIKLSQGAKPGHGGLLPGSKVDKEIASIRGVAIGETVHSPPAHSAFSDPIELLKFIKYLRKLSEGKPIGIKLCVGARSDFFALCKAMVKMAIRPDFISVDGAEGGTGAAPLEFTNSIGMPLDDAIVFINDTLCGFGLRDDIKIIASGKVFTGFDIVAKLALGADLCSSARGMMLSLGCIQALRCNSNACPVGVATTDPGLAKGLVVFEKFKRVKNYHDETIKSFASILGSMGYSHSSQITRRDLFRRMTDGTIRSYDSIYPSLKANFYLDLTSINSWPKELRRDFRLAVPERFGPATPQELESLGL